MEYWDLYNEKKEKIGKIVKRGDAFYEKINLFNNK